MTWRRSSFAVLATHFLLACGGDASQTAASPAGGAGGTTSAAGGSAGHANGGTSSAGTGGIAGAGGQMAQCAAFPVCPVGERTAQGAECPAAPSCHSLSVCGNMIWCVTAGNDGTGGAGGASGAMHDCNGTQCTATQACIAYRTEGGVVMLADAGTCPTGEHLEGTMCQRDFAYKCADLHGLCQNQPVSCACAEPATNNPGVCPAGYGSCSEPGPTEDTVAQLFCQQLVP